MMRSRVLAARRGYAPQPIPVFPTANKQRVRGLAKTAKCAFPLSTSRVTKVRELITLRIW